MVFDAFPGGYPWPLGNLLQQVQEAAKMASAAQAAEEEEEEEDDEVRQWENHGKIVGNSWEIRGKIVGKSWENHEQIEHFVGGVHRFFYTQVEKMDGWLGQIRE